MSSSTQAPPMLAGGLPGLGHLIEAFRNPVGLLRRGRGRHGNVFSIRVLHKTVHVLIGPGLQEAFFRATDDQLRARELLRPLTTPIIGAGVGFDAPPAVMDEQVAFLLPGLRDARMQTYAGIMAEEAAACFGTWGESGEVELKQVTARLTTLITSRCLLGEDFRHHVSGDVVQWYRDLSRGVNLLTLINPYLPLPAFRRRDRARANLIKLIGGFIEQRRARGTVGEDFLQTLMEARYQDGRPLPHDHITGILLGVVFAGQFQSTSLSATAVTHLIEHPEYLSRVMDEQQVILGSPPVFSLDRLKRMTLVENAIQESGRLVPPSGNVILRKVVADFACDDFILRPGSIALTPVRIGHRLPELFRDPDRYDPDRFGPGREEHRQAPYCLMTFGGGKHRCLGMAFAMQQIKVVLSVLLHAYHLELVGPGRIRYRRRLSVAIAPGQISEDTRNGCPYRSHPE